jgi:hypothetical protein
MSDSQLAVLARARSPKRHAHRFMPWYNVWKGESYVPGEKEFSNGRGCIVCHLAEADFEARQKRGRNNRSRGNRSELDVARTYGGEKVGPLGLPEDIRGKLWRTQVKVSQREAPPMWRAEFAKLAGQRDGRTPRLILRFARQGVKSEDYIVVRGSDWLDWFGRDE